jgi:hypothetical protein
MVKVVKTDLTIDKLIRFTIKYTRYLIISNSKSTQLVFHIFGNRDYSEQ